MLLLNAINTHHRLQTLILREVELMNMRFNHRHIVKVYHAHMLSKLHATIVMERLKCNMAQYYAVDGRKFDGSMALKFLREMTSAVLHIGGEHGVVHRDLKPENVMIRQPPGGSFDFVLADFGLSRYTIH